jgi:CRISPR-associated endoribonuclease Cas6
VLLDRLAAHDPDLADVLHIDDGIKPFTCSNVMGPRQGGRVYPEKTYILRYTALTADVAQVLQAAFTPGQTLTFLDTPFTLEALDAGDGGNPWAGQTDYQTLAARYLLPSNGGPRRTWSLHLASPTAFQSQGVTRPLPDPALVFGSLVRTWNAFAPVALPDEGVRRYAENVVVISRFDLRSALGWERGRAMRIGATGKVSYRALNRDRYWLASLSLLADFARYAGVGTLTTMGMGQARRI